MTRTFTFIKREANVAKNLLPTGFIEKAQSGTEGKNGIPGSSLYFIDYDLSNSYYKELIIKRIENNYILSSNKGTKLIGRTYCIGDIIMTQNLNIYRIIESINTTSTHKYDIEYIGSIMNKKENETPSISDRFVDVEFVEYEKTIKECIVPVNRSFDFDASIYKIFKIDDIQLILAYFNIYRSDSIFSVVVSNENGEYLTKKTGDSSTGYIFTTPSFNIEYSYIRNNYSPTTIKELKKVIIEQALMTIHDACDSHTESYSFQSSQFSTTDNNYIKIESGKKYYNININLKSPYLTIDCSIDTYTTGPQFTDTEGIDHKMNSDVYYHSSSYDNAYKKLYGLKFIPAIRFSDPNTDSSLFINYDYYLKIYLKNTKTIQLGTYSLSNGVSNDFSQSSTADPAQSTLNGNFQFYKILEMKMLKLYEGGIINESEDTKPYRIFISDMSADKLHPSGNNIRINYSCPSSSNMNHIKSLYNLTLSWAPIDYDSSNNQYKIPVFSSKSSTKLKSDIVKEYEKNFNSFYSEPYKYNHVQIQYSKRNDEYPCPVNFRGGESAYFSGMTIPSFESSYTQQYTTEVPFIQTNNANLLHIYEKLKTTTENTFDHYVNNILSTNKNVCVTESSYFMDTKYYEEWENKVNNRENIVMKYVTSKLENFILSPDNKYEIVCVKKNSPGVGQVSILPISYQKIVKTGILS